MSELPPRGTGLILGTARTGLMRGRGRPLTELARRGRHEMIFGQVLERAKSYRSEFGSWLRQHPKLTDFRQIPDWWMRRPKLVM